MVLIILMCSVPPLGAFKKGTQEYIYAAIANKLDKYICPDCNKNLILRKGIRYRHHFAHYNDNDPCNYYNKPSESQIHKDAKMLLKSLLLDNNRQIKIIRKCYNDYCDYKLKKYSKKYKIPKISDTSKIIIEHRFNYNGLKIADVAYIDNDEIVCIFEICNTHKTEDNNRPEPWFEINAINFINSVNLNNLNNNIIKIECIRKNKCENCKIIQIKCNRCKNKIYKRISDSKILCNKCTNENYNKKNVDMFYYNKDRFMNGKYNDIL